jgi:hypothetical protein
LADRGQRVSTADSHGNREIGGKEGSKVEKEWNGMRTRQRLTDRQFIQASYPSIKSSQPDLKFMIREAQGVNARAFVRFGTSLPLALPFHGVGILPKEISLKDMEVEVRG